MMYFALPVLPPHYSNSQTATGYRLLTNSINSNWVFFRLKEAKSTNDGGLSLGWITNPGVWQ